MAIAFALGTADRALSCCALALFLSACSEGTPIVVESHQVPNPSGTLVATVEVVDNGLGFGQGALYDEIHISPPGSSAFRHGDPDSSVAFYAESTYEKGHPPSVAWVSNSLLRVTLDPLAKPGRQQSSLNGASIEYLVQGAQRNAP